MRAAAAAITFVLLSGCGRCGAGPGEALPGSGEAARAESTPRQLVAAGPRLCSVGAGREVRCWSLAGEALDPPVATAARLSLAAHRGCAVRPGGDVDCWERAAGPERLRGIGDARDVAVGDGHACALTAGGEVLCWGDNQRGQLGDGTTRARARPAPVIDLGPAAQIVAGAAHTCARLADGAVRCWGGLPTHEDVAREARTPEEVIALVPTPAVRPAPVPDLPAAEQLAAGPEGTCAVTSERRVLCWPGYLGPSARPAPIPWPTDVVRVALGAWGKCAVREGGAVACWDHRDASGAGQLVAPVAVRGVADALELAVAAEGACARLAGGELVCWSSGGAITTLGNGPGSR